LSCTKDKPFDNICGTPGCISPEIYIQKKYSTASDVYALGRVIQDVFGIQNSAGGNNFGGADINAKKGLTKKEDESIINLTNKMLYSNPEFRISLPDAIDELQVIYHKKFPHLIGPAVTSALPPHVEALYEKLYFTPTPELKVSHENSEIKSEIPIEQIIIIETRMAKIKDKVGDGDIQKASFDKMLEFAKSDSSLVSDNNQAENIKVNSLCCAHNVLKLYLNNEITFGNLYKILDALSDKLEKLPHFGLRSRFTKEPSKSAKELRTCLEELRAIHRTSPVEEKAQISNVELSDFYMLARDQKFFLRQRMRSVILLPDNVTEMVIEKYINNKNSDSTKSKDTTNMVKDQSLAYAGELLSQLQSNKLDLARVHNLMDKLTQKVERLPHLGFLSRFTNKTTPTAQLLRECTDALGMLLPNNIRNLSDVFTHVDYAIKHAHETDRNKVDLCLQIQKQLDGYSKTNNPLCITVALDLIEEFKMESRKGGVFDKPRFPIELVIENINKYLRNFEVKLQHKSSP
jgi:serine/threonine protein kinase